jgi:hypothetical protein
LHGLFLPKNRGFHLNVENYIDKDIGGKAGYPSVAVTAGYTTEGEPFGITFSAGAYTEQQLIQFAYAFEQAAMKRKKPHSAWNNLYRFKTYYL